MPRLLNNRDHLGLLLLASLGFQICKLLPKFRNRDLDRQTHLLVDDGISDVVPHVLDFLFYRAELLLGLLLFDRDLLGATILVMTSAIAFAAEFELSVDVVAIRSIFDLITVIGRLLFPLLFTLGRLDRNVIVVVLLLGLTAGFMPGLVASSCDGIGLPQ